MRSGARCEGALLGTVLGGIVISILTSCYGNAGTEFSKKSGGVSNRWSNASGEVPLPHPGYFKKRFMPSRSMMA